jgi:phospholipase C
VPALLVSPWVEPGKISKHLFDHTSVLQFLAEKFTPGTPYSASVAARATQGINSLSVALSETRFFDPPLPPPSEPIFVKSALGDNIATQPDSGIGRVFEQSAREMMDAEPMKVAAKYPELFQWKDSVDKSR